MPGTTAAIGSPLRTSTDVLFGGPTTVGDCTAGPHVVVGAPVEELEDIGAGDHGGDGIAVEDPTDVLFGGPATVGIAPAGPQLVVGAPVEEL